MSTKAPVEFRYFSPAKGRVVPRYGAGSFIGASRGPKGFTVNTEAVVAIPVTETNRFHKEYRKAVELKDLVERTKKDWEAWQEKRAAGRKPTKQKPPESPPAGNQDDDSGNTTQGSGKQGRGSKK